MIIARRQRAIAVNGRFLSQTAITGIQRYAHELIRALDAVLAEVDPESQPIEILAPPNAQDLPQLSRLRLRRVGRLSGQAWEQLELPFFCRGKVLLTLTGAAPLAHDLNVLTIHDAAVFAAPEAYSLRYRLWYRWLHGHLARSARKIITVSDFSRSELIRWCGAEPATVATVHSGADHVFRLPEDESILDRHGLRDRPWVLAVSSRNPTKNFGGILAAIQLLRAEKNIRFVIAGGTNTRVFSEAGKLPAAVTEVGYVSDAQLHSLYRHAGCFVFPSFYEGFGFPPLEAMASGCPAVVSRAASLPEVCGEAALYCDPARPETIAEQIRCALFDPALRERLIRNGREQAARYRWEDTARKTWNILQEICLDLPLSRFR